MIAQIKSTATILARRSRGARVGKVEVRIHIGAFKGNGGRKLRRRVRQSRQLQSRFFIVVQRLFVVGIVYRLAGFRCESVSISHSPRAAPKEQLLRRTDRALVAVGHVHKVVRAADGHDIPHVAAFARAACHRAGHQRAGNARILESASIGCQVAQVLERLGVALADDIGVVLAVEHIDQLPGIAVGLAGSHGCRIVGYLFFDVIKICHELVVIALGGVVRDHFSCFVRRVRHRAGFGGVRHEGIVCSRARAGRIILRDIHGNGQVFYGDIFL